MVLGAPLLLIGVILNGAAFAASSESKPGSATVVTVQESLVSKEKVLEILNQAKELYPNEAEIQYRMVGLYYNIEEESNAIEALNLALLTDFHKNYILKDLFPHVWECETVQNIIKNHNI